MKEMNIFNIMKKPKSLLRSCYDGEEDEIMAAIARGERGDVKNEEGETPLILAGSQDLSMECFKALIKISDINESDKNGRTCLIEAAKGNKCELIKLLLAEEADANKKSVHGFTALAYASYEGHLEAVRILEQKTLPNIVDEHGMTALTLAASEGHVNVVKLLIQRNDPNLQDHEGLTALTMAVQNSHVDVVRILVDVTNANLRTKDSGRTSLMIAADYGDRDMVDLLLPKSDPTLKCFKGMTAEDFAREKGDEDLAERIKSVVEANELDEIVKKDGMKNRKRKI